MGLFDWLFKPTPIESAKPTADEILAVFIKNERKTLSFDAIPLSADPFAHKICAICVALPTESWPEWKGKPLVGMLQINLTRLEWVPDLLKGYELIALYVADSIDNDFEFPENGTENGAGWLVRAYPRLDALVPIQANAISGKRDGIPHDLAPVSVIVEQPSSEDVSEMDQIIWDRLWNSIQLDMTELSEYRNEEKTKLGGWPSLIQGSYTQPYPKYTHVFQVYSDNAIGLNIIDGGAFYLARNPKAPPAKEWLFELQFC